MKEGSLAAIAEISGVSIATVSRVLSGKAGQARISKATVEKVYAAASKLDYSPGILARSLRNDKSKMIGLLLPTVSNPYFAEIASIVIAECRLRGYTIMMMDSAEDEKLFHKSISALVKRKVDGIIAVPCGRQPLFLEGISRDYCPIVLVDRYYKDCNLSYVTTDNYQGGVIATRKLLDAGHRSIACIQGEITSMPNFNRVSGYLDCMKEAGLEDRCLVTGDAFSIENGYREARAILNSKNRPTALFTLSNTITLGAIQAIKEKGLKIGKDISIVSFDNNVSLRFFTPSVTMISQPVEDMAKVAVQILMKAIANPAGNSKGSQSFTHLRLSPSVIEGQSVGRL